VRLCVCLTLGCTKKGAPPGRFPPAPVGAGPRVAQRPVGWHEPRYAPTVDADADAAGPLGTGAELQEIRSGATRWHFDVEFLRSNWSCIWGRGCLGIGDEAAPELGLGCCSVGAVFVDEDEARLTSALAATLDPVRFEHHGAAAEGGIFSDADSTATRVVDGACIFLNRPGFAGGAGCALPLEAIETGESPLDWKPSVCAELPLKVDWELNDDGTETATVRRWERRDWGPEGQTMAWCCTEGELAYGGDRPVVDSLGDELTSIVGREVYVELRRRLGRP
jgi:hypothetical protein